MYQIKNEELTLEIISFGAEMKSLKDNKTGVEYLWCADGTYWNRTSPILFPVVGNYRDKKSIYGGKEYILGQHGFARATDFVVESQKVDEIWLTMGSSEETLAVYPFEFKLSIGYKLNGRTVEVLWKVENLTEGTMYFSIGGCPAFNCPIEGTGDQTAYSLKFDTEGPLTVSVLNEAGTLLSDKKKVFELNNQKMALEYDLFHEDALIIENAQTQKVALVNAEGEEYLTVAMDTPLCAIWSPAGKHAPFVCVEPWYGRTDHVSFNQKLEEREYGNMLAKGEVFEKSYTITVK